MSFETTGVCAVVLAAGASRRFGDDPPKQLALFHGEPLVRRAARACLASKCAAVSVVLGHRQDEVAAALAGLEVSLIPNPDFAQGKATSVRAAITALPATADAALFVPCDQPLLDAATIDRLLTVFRQGAGDAAQRIVVPGAEAVCGGWRRGAPVLFPRRYFGELLGLRGESGGRELLRRHPEAVVEVRLASDLPLRDTDTRQRLRELEALARPAPP